MQSIKYKRTTYRVNRTESVGFTTAQPLIGSLLGKDHVATENVDLHPTPTFKLLLLSQWCIIFQVLQSEHTPIF